jgi:uncharacterized membrane protein YqjE
MASSDRAPLATPQARDALNRLIDGFQTLVREHLALAKVELKEDLRRMGRSLLLAAVGIPALLAGYLLLNAAVALLLSAVMASWLAFGIVAFANLGVGAALTVVFGKKARETAFSMPAVGEELRRDRELLATVGGGGAAEPARPAAEPAARPGPTGEPTAEGATAASTPRSWTPAPRHAADGRADHAMAPGRPFGKAGSTPGLEARRKDATPGQPVAGATSTPNGEPMTATHRDLTH